MKRVEVVVGVVAKEGRILISRRTSDNPALPGFWEFPGGKVEPGETHEQALARELLEELGVEVQPVYALPVVEHTYPAVHVRLVGFVCTFRTGEPQPLASAEVRWIDVADLPMYPFPPANASLLESVRKYFAVS